MTFLADRDRNADLASRSFEIVAGYRQGTDGKRQAPLGLIRYEGRGRRQWCESGFIPDIEMGADKVIFSTQTEASRGTAAHRIAAPDS